MENKINKEKIDGNKNVPPKLFLKKENCCGCSACFSICPQNAIIMEVDDEGFLYPQIDEDNCIGCLRCISVCSFKADQTMRGYLNCENN